MQLRMKSYKFISSSNAFNFFNIELFNSKPISEEVLPKLATLNEDVLDNIKSTTMEICMKLSTTGQQDLLLLYCTAVQSLLTQLSSEGVSESQLSSINQQFDFIVVVGTADVLNINSLSMFIIRHYYGLRTST